MRLAPTGVVRLVVRLALTLVSGLSACGDVETSRGGRDGARGEIAASGAAANAAAGSSPDAGDLEFGNADPVGQAAIEREPQSGFEAADAGCAQTSIEAQQVVVEEVITVEETVEEVAPVALYVMLDQSGSMNSGELWMPATAALRRFVADPSSEGLDIALEFFPPEQDGAGECDGDGYDTPSIELGRLPEHAPTVLEGLDARPVAQGLGGTPIEGGLRGGIHFCEGLATTTPDEPCVVVLITDGDANACEDDAEALAAIAADAFAGGMGVRTFTVGLDGADFELLDRIALTSGAVDCDPADDARFSCDLSGGPERLSEALSKIRQVVTSVVRHTEVVTRVEETPLECEWEIPEAPPGEVFDRDKVNVVLTGDGVDVTLGKAESIESCGPRGWHYDRAEAPTRIVACEETCSTIRETENARVDILLGCASRPLL